MKRIDTLVVYGLHHLPYLIIRIPSRQFTENNKGKFSNGARVENRTQIFCLQNSCSAIELHWLAGMAGFEPTTISLTGSRSTN